MFKIELNKVYAAKMPDGIHLSFLPHHQGSVIDNNDQIWYVAVRYLSPEYNFSIDVLPIFETCLEDSIDTELDICSHKVNFERFEESMELLQGHCKTTSRDVAFDQPLPQIMEYLFRLGVIDNEESVYPLIVPATNEDVDKLEDQGCVFKKPQPPKPVE